MDQRLGDKILEKYMNGESKTDIMHTLNISENTFNYWEKLNKNELARVDDYLEKQRLKHALKIQSVHIPTTDSDDDEEEGVADDDEEVGGDDEEDVEEEEKKVEEDKKPAAVAVYHYDHHKFLHKEPIVQKLSEEDVRKMTIINKRQQLLEKIHKLNDLHARRVIGQEEYIKAANILQKQLSSL